jgi:hypothetical protein
MQFRIYVETRCIASLLARVYPSSGAFFYQHAILTGFSTTIAVISTDIPSLTGLLYCIANPANPLILQIMVPTFSLHREIVNC